MVRTQIQLPDFIYKEAKRIVEEREMSLAEVVRRGLEHMMRLHPRRPEGEPAWSLPKPRRLGHFLAPVEDWRELANVSAPWRRGRA